MRNFALSVVFVCSMVSVASAQGPDATTATTPPPKPAEWSVSLNLGVYSRYFGSVAAATFAREVSNQNEVDLNWQKGRAFGSFVLWEAQGLQSKQEPFSQEVDLGAMVGYSTNVADFSASFSHFVLVPEAGSDLQTVNITASKTIDLVKSRKVVPYLKADIYWPTSHKGFDGGTFVTAGASYLHPLNERLTGVVQLQLARDVHGAFGAQPSWLYRADLAVQVRIGSGWVMSPMVRLGGSFTDPGKPGTGTVGIAFTKTFRLKRL